MNRRILAVITAVMLAVSCLMLASCGSSGGEGSGSGSSSESGAIEDAGGSSGSGAGGEAGGSSGTEEKDYDTENSYVAGKIFVLEGLSSEDEDFDKELIKDMYNTRDITRVMSIYFEKGGAAYVSSLMYGGEVITGGWGEKDGEILMQLGEELFEIEKADDGSISTTMNEEDGEEFMLTLIEAEEPPEALAEYFNKQ